MHILNLILTVNGPLGRMSLSSRLSPSRHCSAMLNPGLCKPQFCFASCFMLGSVNRGRGGRLQGRGRERDLPVLV